MKYFKESNIIWGIILVLVAAYMVISGMGLISIGIFSGLLSAVFVLLIVKCSLELNISGVLFSIAHIIVIYREFIVIPDTLASWVIILASTVLGIGLDIIFKEPIKKIKGKKVIAYEYRETGTSRDENGYTKETTEDGKHVEETFTSNEYEKISNNFGEKTRYISGNRFKRTDISNSFGALSVYFETATLINNNVSINVENSFGETCVYVPASWNISFTENSTLGSVHIFGTPSTDPSAPVVQFHISNSFGDVKVYCE